MHILMHLSSYRTTCLLACFHPLLLLVFFLFKNKACSIIKFVILSPFGISVIYGYVCKQVACIMMFLATLGFKPAVVSLHSFFIAFVLSSPFFALFICSSAFFICFIFMRQAFAFLDVCFSQCMKMTIPTVDDGGANSSGRAKFGACENVTGSATSAVGGGLTVIGGDAL